MNTHGCLQNFHLPTDSPELTHQHLAINTHHSQLGLQYNANIKVYIAILCVSVELVFQQWMHNPQQ